MKTLFNYIRANLSSKNWSFLEVNYQDQTYPVLGVSVEENELIITIRVEGRKVRLVEANIELTRRAYVTLERIMMRSLADERFGTQPQFPREHVMVRKEVLQDLACAEDLPGITLTHVSDHDGKMSVLFHHRDYGLVNRRIDVVHLHRS